MTICTAAICRWYYDAEKKDSGPAIITASDRMLTDIGLGMEYERDFSKSKKLTERTLVLIANNLAVHSEVIKGYVSVLQANPETDVPKIAHGYGQRLRDYAADRAEEAVLGVFKMTTDDFIRRNRELQPNIAADLASEMRQYPLNAGGLIVGCDETQAHLYHIDEHGIITCHDDTGFVSAGIGGIHSSAEFMRARYAPTWTYSDALYTVYSAKRSADAAPGCGPQTDMHLINRLGIHPIGLELMKAMEQIYEEQQNAVKEIVKASAARLMAVDPAAEKEAPAKPEVK